MKLPRIFEKEGTCKIKGKYFKLIPVDETITATAILKQDDDGRFEFMVEYEVKGTPINLPKSDIGPISVSPDSGGNQKGSVPIPFGRADYEVSNWKVLEDKVHCHLKVTITIDHVSGGSAILFDDDIKGKLGHVLVAKAYAAIDKAVSEAQMA